MRALPSLLHALVTTQQMVGDAIVSALWRFKCLWGNCGESFVWCYRTRTFLVFKQAKLPEIVYKSPVDSSALYQQYIFANMDFPLYCTSFKKHASEPFEPSKDLRVALNFYVPRYERMISEKATKKTMSLFLMSSNVWKYDWGFSIVLSPVLGSYVLREVIEKMRILRNRTVSVICTFFFEGGGANVTLVLWKWSQLLKRLGTYALAPFFFLFTACYGLDSGQPFLIFLVNELFMS